MRKLTIKIKKIEKTAFLSEGLKVSAAGKSMVFRKGFNFENELVDLDPKKCADVFINRYFEKDGEKIRLK